MKKFRKLLPDREKLLYILFIYRAIPRDYFNPELRINKSLVDILYYLKKEKFIKIVTTPSYHEIIYLAQKGYEYLEKKVITNRPLQYSFMTSRTRCSPTNIHQFMHFKYLRFYIDKNWDLIKSKNVTIYIDTDVNNCKFRFVYQGKYFTLRPDIIIKIKEGDKNEKVILVEDDRGSEGTIKVYRKFLQYAFFLDYQQDCYLSKREREYFPEIEFQFIALSGNRLENLFFKENLARYFQYQNVYMGHFIMRIQRLGKLFQASNFKLKITDYPNYESLQEHDFVETLKKFTMFGNVL